MKKKTKAQNIPVMDERQQNITGKALNIAGAFLALCMIIAVICDLILSGEPGWELFALVGSCIVFLIANKKLGNIQAPKNWYGKELPTGDSREDKTTRRNSYIIDSLLLGGTFTLTETLLMVFGKDDLAELEMVKSLIPNGSYGLLVVVTALLTFVIIFGISFLVNYLFHEKYEVKAYRKMLSDLED